MNKLTVIFFAVSCLKPFKRLKRLWAKKKTAKTEFDYEIYHLEENTCYLFYKNFLVVDLPLADLKLCLMTLSKGKVFDPFFMYFQEQEKHARTLILDRQFYMIHDTRYQTSELCDWGSWELAHGEKLQEWLITNLRKRNIVPVQTESTAEKVIYRKATSTATGKNHGTGHY